MKKIYLLMLCAAVLAIACGAGGTKLQIKVDGKDSTLDGKSSGTYTSTKTFTMNKDGQATVTKAASHYIALANYDLDTSSGMISLDKPLTGAEQIRVTFQLVGEEGTDDKAAIKTGTYTTKAEKYNKVDTVGVMVFADGKEKKNWFNIDKAEGEVKINSVSGETVSGEIDLTEGDKSLKGNFTAKITAKK